MNRAREICAERDNQYLSLIRDAIAVCRNYRPMFGKGKSAGFSLEEFQQLYQQDPFYTWLGLDSPIVYAAHKASGGMTSLYRQIGIGCERLFRQVLQDTLGLTSEQASWSYQVPGPSGKQRTLFLDGRIAIEDVEDTTKAQSIRDWLRQAAASVNVDPKVIATLTGPVFEVRQGYKSKDSKRQNADVGNASNAYAHSYMPVVAVLSTQIDSDIAIRYARAQWVILKGTLGGTPLDSLYRFSTEVLGYDLAAFFGRNSESIKAEILAVIEALLQ